MDSDLKNGDSDLKNEEMTEGQEMSEDSDLGSEKELTEEDLRTETIYSLKCAEDSLKSLEGKENTMTTSCLEICVDDFEHIYGGFDHHAKKHADFAEVISGYEWGKYEDKRHTFHVNRGYLIEFMIKSSKIVKELESKEHLKVWHDFAFEDVEKTVNTIIDRLNARDGKTSSFV
uniref:Uncharacterized protein n=1 Tax=Meloidogyne enterolobii TaxID=390850 RepID=A0A6V7TMV5_MELEN|nr:unnamed protein product [Meloidogyne enterolobii]